MTLALCQTSALKMSYSRFLASGECVVEETAEQYGAISVLYCSVGKEMGSNEVSLSWEVSGRPLKGEYFLVGV